MGRELIPGIATGVLFAVFITVAIRYMRAFNEWERAIEQRRHVFDPGPLTQREILERVWKKPWRWAIDLPCASWRIMRAQTRSIDDPAAEAARRRFRRIHGEVMAVWLASMFVWAVVVLLAAR